MDEVRDIINYFQESWAFKTSILFKCSVTKMCIFSITGCLNQSINLLDNKTRMFGQKEVADADVMDISVKRAHCMCVTVVET